MCYLLILTIDYSSCWLCFVPTSIYNLFGNMVSINSREIRVGT
uniref:Uncharacterized protein n=1 Tax=Medicago truncatula TaxID=3880 RepID=I3SQM7_MEDTR|nr:unknown [Medicago truncatula]